MTVLATLTLIITILGILEQVASGLMGNSEMWEIIKKFLGLLAAFRDYFTKEKQKEVDRLKEQETNAHKEVEVEYEKAKAKLEADGWSGDSFESALDELRSRQSS